MIKKILIEQAEISRILRGYARTGEQIKFDSVEKLKERYPNYTKPLSGVELEMLQQDLFKRATQ